MEPSVIVYAVSRSGHSWIMDMFRVWMGKGYVIRNIESVYPAQYMERVFGNYGQLYNPNWPAVIVVRDYLNWAASWIKFRKNSGNAAIPEKVMERADMWYEITREAIGETNYIPSKYMLNYDHFTWSEKYRYEVCSHLGGKYAESKLNYVPVRGEGSSFDLRAYQNRGSEMKVRERWRWFLTEEGEPYQCYLALRPDILEFYMEHWELPENISRFCESIMAKT